MLRLPRHCLPANLADYAVITRQRYADSAFSVRFVEEDCVLTWEFNDDSGDTYFEDEENGSGWMSALLPLRDELRRGDWRALYLGWFARVEREEIGDDELEPLLPPGLIDLTPAQQALADFLLLDPDWLTAAAAASPQDSGQVTPHDDLARWSAQADPALLAAAACQVLQGDSMLAESTLRSAYLAWQQATRGAPEPTTARRRVEEIAHYVDAARHIRLDHEAHERAAAQARAAAERAARLARLASAPQAIWQGIDKTLQGGTGRAYDLALTATSELAEALQIAGRSQEFADGLTCLLSRHGKRKAWLDRLRRAGLYSG